MNRVEAEQTGRKAGRPRSAQAHRAILEATLEVFAEVGLQGLSIEAVAEQAGVGKTTIYRRWSSKEDMLKEALDLVHESLPIPDTGNIRDDLLSMTRLAQAILSGNSLMGKLVLKLIAEMKTRPEIYRVFTAKLMEPRIRQFRQIIERAQQRGELRSDLDVMPILYQVFSSLLYSHLFIDVFDFAFQHVFDPEIAVDTLLHGIGAEPGEKALVPPHCTEKPEKERD